MCPFCNRPVGDELGAYHLHQGWGNGRSVFARLGPELARAHGECIEGARDSALSVSWQATVGRACRFCQIPLEQNDKVIFNYQAWTIKLGKKRHTELPSEVLGEVHKECFRRWGKEGEVSFSQGELFT